jgi:disulfide bond formation protein DsbB
MFKFKYSRRSANLLTDIGLAIVLLATLGVQFLLHEAPCELCLLQRLALLGAAMGFLMNWRFGISPAHYAIAELFAFFGMVVAMRQITLHIIPGTGSYGDAFFGLHLYSWSFIACTLVLLRSIVLMLSDFSIEP